MDIEQFAYLWDGSQPECELQHVSNTAWHFVFEFGQSGPDNNTISKLRKLLPELRNEALPKVHGLLNSCNS
jgi:hypothetical protein